jgi:tRNA A37 threonylcarbamoyladenosine dehydratase
LQVLVVGAGTVGVAERLAATGQLEVGVIDFDAVEPINLDRMIGATRLDAANTRRWWSPPGASLLSQA